jgi:putative cardiolipin synthase
VGPRTAEAPGKAGIHPLPDPRDSFVARALLAAAADRSLDVQYYIWHGDETGYLLFEALWQAADRGVRVRLLLDDNNTSGLDETIAALDAHPMIEVRLYNPFLRRRARWLDFLTDFSRMNCRMHNKSFTADNQATIVGGRNVGNEYFAAGTGVVFADLDVVAVGPIVWEVSDAFDLYWNSSSAYPAALLLGAPRPDGADELRRKFAAVRDDPRSRTYLEALREATLVRQLLDGGLPFVWTTARLVRDDPAKTLDKSARTELLMLADLLPLTGQPEAAFALVSPYFVPGKEGTEALSQLAARGVRIRVLTNSLTATDVVPVHAGYAKRRRALLRAGVQLYELKPAAIDAEPDRDAKYGGSSSASLHAKTFAVDRERVFVGSFNFDPRSALLNTEMGLVIESPELARRIDEAFEAAVPQVAYEVRLTEAGDHIEWIDRSASGEQRYRTEPDAGVLRRTWLWLLSILPIEWLL